jgi:hypothetical protein
MRTQLLRSFGSTIRTRNVRSSWVDAAVYAGLSRGAIADAPEYTESQPVTREYEDRLYLYYGRPPYWLHEAGHGSAALSQSNPPRKGHGF